MPICCGFKTSLQIRVHGHTLRFELQMHMAVVDLEHELFVEFLAELLLLQLLEAITFMRMNKKHCY
jgi:hypothetical protein